ncbi:capsular polysaccharide biosynthesis protein [Oligella urethralis]|uniref:capsular polysaccharide biosynthesis protein n=1 Tax=Oligella urethralis TaxID=90245 RepID=UPI0027BB0581|nr:capsular polysaccharide biosynthesis protein [Oligella urethralis]
MKKKQVPSYAISRQDVGLRRNDTLHYFLGSPVKVDWYNRLGSVVTRLGWGRKPSGQRAVRIAVQRGSPFCLLEDGFIRSVGLGNTDSALSLVVDHQGIYYDATAPSELESLIQRSLSSAEQQRAQALMLQWRKARVSKYNHLPEYADELPENYVLVVDQTFGDASIQYGLASAASFQLMLEAALSNHPEATVLVKTHPDVFAGRKKGHFDIQELQKNPRILVLAEDVHPVRLIEESQAVYVVTSQMGFEGLLWAKPVYTFGMPFYAGYGLTHDALATPLRRKPVTIEQLVYAALIVYPRYLDPESLQLCEVERLIEWMRLQREVRARYPKHLYALNFSRWKKPIVRDFFQMSEVHFIDSLRDFPRGDNLIVWGMAKVAETEPAQLLRVEDGFLRSVGLGADLIRPLSWVIDRRGIYYNAHQVSDLEAILQTTLFDDSLFARGTALRERIVASNLTKYNVGCAQWQRPAHARRVILVPGQVESDASIRYGSRVVTKNMQLLQTVRAANPEAYILYKPHPDVVTGLRDKSENEDKALDWCDEVLTEHAIGSLFTVVDEVHVLTSLAGFEALMRGCKVVTYGQPFYAGWGLTQDIHPPEGRGRKLQLDELVAGVLILYPVYLHPTSGRFSTPEAILDVLIRLKEGGVPTLPWWRKAIRPLLSRVVAWRRRRVK